MTTVPRPNERPEAPLFTDGLGDRVVAADGATGELLQILRIRPALTAVPSFEFALRERAARLANFRHAYYARVRRIDRHPAPGLVDRLGPRRRHAPLRHPAGRARAQPAARYQRGAVPDPPARAVRGAAARKCTRRRARPDRARAPDRHAARAAGDRRARARIGGRAAAVQPRSAVAGVPHRRAAERRPAALRSSRRRHRHRPGRAGARARPSARPPTSSRTSSRAAERRARAHRARRRAAAVGAAARLDRPRAAARSAPRLRVGDGSADRARRVVADDSMYVAAPVALETFLSRYIAALLERRVEPLPAPSASCRRRAAPPRRRPVVRRRRRRPRRRPRHGCQRTGAGSGGPGSRSSGALYARRRVHRAAPRQRRRSCPGRARPSAPARPGVTARDAEADATVPAGPGCGTRSHRAHRRRRFQGQTRPIHAVAVQPGRAVQPAARRDASARGDRVVVTGRRRTRHAREGQDSRPALVPPGCSSPLRRSSSRGRRRLAARTALAPQRPPPRPARLSCSPILPACQVFVDGVERGKTPARLSVEAGSHILELRGRGVPRVIPSTSRPARKCRNISSSRTRLRPAACVSSRSRRAPRSSSTASIAATRR